MSQVNCGTYFNKEELVLTRLVDIAKPDYGSDDNFSLEYAMKTMVTLDTWLEQGIMEVLVEADTHMEDMLKVISCGEHPLV